MNRETKEIITPIQKHKVILKTYITGREKREINNVFLTGTKFSPNVKPELDGSLVQKSQDKLIEIIVVSVNNKTENILNTVLDMHSQDFDFVLAEINNITSKKK